MNRDLIRQGMMFGLLVIAGVGVRLFFRDLPNFAPIAALALFAGFYFRSSAVAVALPLTVMVISDQWLGGYHWLVMAAVYAHVGSPSRPSLLGPSSLFHGRRRWWFTGSCLDGVRLQPGGFARLLRGNEPGGLAGDGYLRGHLAGTVRVLSAGAAFLSLHAHR